MKTSVKMGRDEKMERVLTPSGEGLLRQLRSHFCVTPVRQSGIKPMENELIYAAEIGVSIRYLSICDHNAISALTRFALVNPINSAPIIKVNSYEPDKNSLQLKRDFFVVQN